MANISFKYRLFVWLYSLVHLTTASPPQNFRVDVHTHVFPAFYKQALLDAGFPTNAAGSVVTDGFPAPNFTVEGLIYERVNRGYNYSLLSVSSPGVHFLDGQAAENLARRLNDEMASYIRTYPKQLGAFGVLPLPDIQASLDAIKYTLDVLKFDGIGLFSNYGGVYLGDSLFDPVFAELDRRGATVFVHPTAPPASPKLFNESFPLIEFPFDTTRALTNFIYTRTNTRYTNLRLIWAHGGGTVPYLSSRISYIHSLPFVGGYDYTETLKEFGKFYYDTAILLVTAPYAALKEFVSVDHVLTGSDYPYFSDSLVPTLQAALSNFAGYTAHDKQKIAYKNAFSLFPNLATKFPNLNSRDQGEEVAGEIGENATINLDEILGARP